MVSISELSQWPTSYLVTYIHQHTDQHYAVTHDQMVMIVAKMMMNSGELDSDDAQYMNIPGFDQIYIAEGGDLNKAITHLTIDVSANPVGTILRLL